VVNCLILQKAGAGLHYNCVTHWDAKHDSSVTVKFENDSLSCIVTIFGIAI
jgi:dynein light chain Tctex-type 1